MWPLLLNMTRDDCRRTLRSLELEAYSNMISVFRAQGPLEETRKKLLEDLRSILNISNDRHSAEARRVANDELLATIAEQLVGPHTNLDWVNEGRRLIPLMPRGTPQTAFTELADQVSETSRAENKELQKKLEAEKCSKSNDMELTDLEDGGTDDHINYNDDILYPPIVMEDESSKVWETELIARKRKVVEDVVDEGGGDSDDDTPSLKNLRNSPPIQKHLNLAQIYSKYSQPSTGKTSSMKHSYNQVSKVSTSKSHSPRPQERKKRAPKNYKKAAQVVPKSQSKKQIEPYKSPSKLPMSPHDYGGPPGSFQATYAQSILGNKVDFVDEPKPLTRGEPVVASDSPTLQLLTAPVRTSELITENSASASPQPKQIATGKPCELLIKSQGDLALADPNRSSENSIPKSEPIKVMSNRPILVTSNSAQKFISTQPKLLQTKILGSAPKSPSTPTVLTNKMIFVSKPDHKNLNSPKFVIASSASTISRETTTSVGGHASPRVTESIVAKGIPATDVKVSSKTKTFLLNPKSGQKMQVVLPGKPRPVVETLPLKGVPATIKSVTGVASSQQVSRTSIPTISARPPTVVSLPASSPNFTPIKTANMADIVPVKGISSTSARISSPIVRPSTGKGGVIVVQKGTTIGKTIAFKNGGETKIIMGKNMNQLIQASKNDTESKGNVILLDLNNERNACVTSVTEILEAAKNESRSDCFNKEEVIKRSCVTDWEMELDSVPEATKGKTHEDDHKLNSMHLDLGMSSDSDTESQDDIRQSITPSRESGEIIFDAPSGLIQDDVSCSIDSTFGLSKSKLSLIDKAKRSPKLDSPIDKSETEELNKAKEKLSEKVAKSVQNRIDLFSTAIQKSEINFDSYLEENMIEDEIFSEESDKCPGKEPTLDISELLTK